MTILALVSMLAAPPSPVPLGIKTARLVASMTWARIPPHDPQGRKERLAIELRMTKMLPEPFPIHLRIPRAGLPANPPRLMLLRQVDVNGKVQLKTACQWDAINERTAELTWFMPRSSAGVCRFVLDFAPAATDVVVQMRKAGGKLVYEAVKKATYTLNPVGARIEKLEVESLNPPDVAAGNGLNVIPGTETKAFKIVQELSGPLCYRVAALADGRVVKRLTLYAGIYWHETEVRAKPLRLLHQTIEITGHLGTPRSSGAYRRDGVLIGVATIGGPAAIKTTRSGFDLRAPGPAARFLTFAGFDKRDVALVTLERLIISADAIAVADAKVSVLH